MWCVVNWNLGSIDLIKKKKKLVRINYDSNLRQFRLGSCHFSFFFKMIGSKHTLA